MRRSFLRAPFLVPFLLGALIRAAALPLVGAGDVGTFKAWMYHATEGPTRIYGVDDPPHAAVLSFGDVSDLAPNYPPLFVYELALVGHLYSQATRGRFPDTTRLTVVVKALPVVFEAGFLLLAFAAARNAWGETVAYWVVIAYWLNPAVILNGSVGGYMDALFVLPAAASLIAAGAGRPMLAGSLIAAAVLTKPQGVFIVPVAALAVWHAGAAGGAPARLARAALAATVVTSLMVAPYVVAGTWRNMLFMLRLNVWIHQDMSSYAYNLWWIVGYALRAGYEVLNGTGVFAAFAAPAQPLGFPAAAEHGLPHLELVATVLAGACIVWGVWTARHAGDLPRLSALAAFSLQAYATVGPSAHENHWYGAVPLLVLAAAGRRRFVPILATVTGIAALNELFWGVELMSPARFQLPATFTVVDTTILLAAVNCAALVWHAAVLRAECRS